MSKKNKILIIDDEIHIRNLLRISLEAQSYSIEEAGTGDEGLKLNALIQPSLILLDLGLPDMDGIEVLKNIRTKSNAPVIVISVRNDEQSIVKALDNGANDYMTKPFNIGELFARIRVIFRTKDSHPEKPIFEIGELKIDFNSRIVTINAEEVKLTSTEYSLLCVFIKNAGKILTHFQLLNEVWGGNYVEHSQYLRVYVGHLRQKIEKNPNKPELIITEPGIGYRFKGESKI